MKDLEERAEKAASEAKCGRCGEVILRGTSAVGMVTGYYRAVALGVTAPFQLCGNCGIALREFINPRLEDDPIFQRVKKKIQEMWA